jgi:hypothetical protein
MVERVAARQREACVAVFCKPQPMLWVFPHGVLFHLKDVLKEKSRPSADDGGQACTDVLELVRP